MVGAGHERIPQTVADFYASTIGVVPKTPNTGKSVTAAGKALELSQREWAILECMILNAGHIVSKNKLINIPSASTGSNNNTRSYRAEWHWTCRLLEGLTATQRNTLSADYLEYPFSAENNRLTLDYAAVTTLNAIMNPRLSINVTHNSRRSPAGSSRRRPRRAGRGGAAIEPRYFTPAINRLMGGVRSASTTAERVVLRKTEPKSWGSGIFSK